jgi:hypothetical protein
MFKRIGCSLLVVIVAVLLIDLALSAILSRVFIRQVGSDDYLGALERRISVGMSRIEAEGRLIGYRKAKEQVNEENGLTIAYGYWFGFLPPMSPYGIKYAGEVIVAYSPAGRVIDTSHWYN